MAYQLFFDFEKIKNYTIKSHHLEQLTDEDLKQKIKYQTLAWVLTNVGRGEILEKILCKNRNVEGLSDEFLLEIWHGRLCQLDYVLLKRQYEELNYMIQHPMEVKRKSYCFRG